MPEGKIAYRTVLEWFPTDGVLNAAEGVSSRKRAKMKQRASVDECQGMRNGFMRPDLSHSGKIGSKYFLTFIA
jgi:hypothetical protein